MARRLYSLLPALFLAAAFVWAAPNDNGYTRLARLSYIEGNVSCQHAADVDWSAASVNLPLEPGDRLYTGHDGRAEIEFDDGSIFRLARNTDIEILSLKEELIQIRILVGLSSLIVGGDTDFEINTAAAAYTALRQGTYRFGAEESGESFAVVRQGELEAANDGFSRRIRAGEIVRVTMRDGVRPEFARYEDRDEWDEWNDRRDADRNAYADRRYLPAGVSIGVHDLNRHGRWIHVESYGLAWVPYGISVSWAPYSTGRWCYRPFYGWTWVSYEPWGWLPYHYGRWYRSSIHGWCWLPGPSFAFNFWSPALVTFYRGPGWISWCPLGPGDYYNLNRYHYNRRIYGHQLVRLRTLHTRAPGDPFHRGRGDAFRTVDIDQFRNGSFGERGREAGRRDIDRPWKQGEVVRDRLPIQPTTTSFRPAPDRRANGPEHKAKPLPAVVRHSPDGNLRGQEQFRRITNPGVPELPPRAARRMTESQGEPRQTIEYKPVARTQEPPRSEHANPGVQNQPGNSTPEQNGRRTETYRRTGPAQKNAEGDRSGKRPAPVSRSEAHGPDTRYDPGGIVEERPAPEQRKAQPVSSQRVSPRVEEYYRPNSYVAQPSGTSERRSHRGPGSSVSPPAEDTPILEPPRSEFAPSNGTPRMARTPSSSAPRGDSGSSYRPPRTERAPEHAVPGSAAPSAERNIVPRTPSAPSPVRGGANPSPSSGDGPGGRKSPDQSGGDHAQGRGNR